MIKIVVLDGYAANPGDLSWDSFRQFGELTVYDRTSSSEAAERIGDATIVITNKIVFDEALFASCKNLKCITLLATGYNNIDLDAARRHGVAVCNVPGYSTDSVAQLVFGFVLENACRVAAHSDWVHSGGWQSSPDFSRFIQPINELSQKTFGVVGYGSIGRRAAAIALAFGMRVVAYGRHLSQSDCADGVTAVPLERLLATSDYISLHCPLNDDSRGMINSQSIAAMKRGAYLINTARGGLVDEAALAAALNDGLLSGAGLDVVSAEPISADNPLLHAKNCTITPHIAWATFEARTRLFEILHRNIQVFLEGGRLNRVD